jgi:hypothetical protein
MLRFGDGFSVTLVLATDADVDVAKSFVVSFSGVENLKVNNLTIGFNVSRNQEVSKIGAKILANRKSLNLVDFGIKQTTLDEVKFGDG